MMRPRVAPDLEERIDRLTFGAGRLQPASEPAPAAFRHLLVAADGSPASEHALAWAADLAKQFRARLRLATVAPPAYAYAVHAQGAPVLPEAFHVEGEAAQEALGAAERSLRALGQAPDPALLHGAPVEELVKIADREDVDLVVLGSHGRGPMGRLLLGSVADGVKNRARASVLIAKGPPRPRQLLVATDGSRLSKRAAGLALQLADGWAAHVTILHALPPPSFGPLEDSQRTFEAAFAGLGLPWDLPNATYDLQFGVPAERIVQTARDKACGLILMGSRGLGGVESLLAGSVSNRVAHEAPCSVLLVKEPTGP